VCGREVVCWTGGQLSLPNANGTPKTTQNQEMKLQSAENKISCLSSCFSASCTGSAMMSKVGRFGWTLLQYR
jgi:hypothetical protein